MKKLKAGMRLDELPVDQLPGTWGVAKNISVFQKFSAITNEDGVDNVTPAVAGTGTANYPINKKLIGSVVAGDNKILFFGTTNPSDSEIGRIKDDGNYYPIIKDVILGFNQNNPIQATFENKFNNNIIVAWRDPYLKILNIDCIPFGIDPVTFQVVTADINKAKAFLNLFTPYTTPRIDEYLLQVKEGQGSLPTGAYYPILSYELLDGTITSYSKVYNGIPIFSDNTNALTNTIGGGLIIDPTNKAIEIVFNNVDTNYKRIRVGYLYVNGGVVTAKLEVTQLITSSSMKVILTGNNTTTLTLDEVLVPNIVYDKAKSITSLQKKLYIAGPEEPAFYNYQTYANLITIRWVREKELTIQNTAKSSINSSGTMITNGTYQDGSKVFFDKSFKSGEAYALYIGLNFKNGIKSKKFHIPGRDFIAGDRDVLNPTNPAVYNALDGGNPIYKYQVLNTNTVVAAPGRSGNMGYWENENEEYPLDPNNSLAVHPDFANIPGVTISNRKVRHHTFPDLTYLSKGAGRDRFLDGAFEADTFPAPFTYPNVDLTSKAFGIEVSNVNIPANLLPLIDSWEIFYAERGNSNIRTIGNDCISETVSAESRTTFQMFDLMVNKAGLFPTYLKQVAQFINQGGTANEETNFIDYTFSSQEGNASITPVTEFKYLGQATTVPYNNASRADNISIKPLLGGPIDPTAVGTQQRTELYDFCIYKRNIYLNFNSQTLVSTGIVNTVTASGIQATKKIYGGDVYICRHSPIPTSTGTKYMSYICESASNIGLRSEDLSQSKFFAPKYTNPTPSWYGYNSDFNCVNTFNQVDIYYPPINCTDQDVTMHLFRIPYSAEEGSENSSINWRIFKVNAYYDMPSNKGEIWNILGNDRTLYIHLKNSLFIAEIKDKLSTTQADVYLGNTDIFSRPPQEALPVNEGFAGTQSQFACIVTKMGYCFIDRQQGKVFVVPFGTYKPVEISEQGMYNFFANNSQTSDDTLDNPFIGMGYTMGFDTENNRLLICKKDDLGYSFTLSYSPDLNDSQGAWICFHDYKPNYFIYDRSGFFAIENLLFKIFRHNSATNKCRFYDGTIHVSYIDVIFNDNPEVTKRFENVNWVTTVEKSGVNYKKETITQLIVYNDTQCSGIVPLTTVNLWYGKDVRNVEDTWNFNKFRDLIKDPSLSFIDSNFDLIGTNIDTNKSWFNKSLFISKYVIFRMINDNASQKNVHISLVGSNIKKSDR